MPKERDSWITISILTKSSESMLALSVLLTNGIPARTKKNPIAALVRILTLFTRKAEIQVQVPESCAGKGRGVLKILNLPTTPEEP